MKRLKPNAYVLYPLGTPQKPLIYLLISVIIVSTLFTPIIIRTTIDLGEIIVLTTIPSLLGCRNSESE
ncbi:hypothetical protein [Lysinibacillus xylanilyticus]|uniref:hypothetical protein n=1 Tax=Lysinibacillus xylanilyticus TaxID=582475 RepID=UPI003D0461E9